MQSSDHTYPLTQFEGYIDVGKHLSLLHSQLVENIATPDTENAGLFSDLQPILADLTDELNTSEDDISNKVGVKLFLRSMAFLVHGDMSLDACYIYT